jgi:hypothetical protein
MVVDFIRKSSKFRRVILPIPSAEALQNVHAARKDVLGAQKLL